MNGIRIAGWSIIVGILVVIASSIGIFHVLENCPHGATDPACTVLQWRDVPVALCHLGLALVCWGGSFLFYRAARGAFAEGRGFDDPADKLPWLIRISPFGDLASLASPVMGWVWTYLFLMTGCVLAVGAGLTFAGVDYLTAGPPP